MRSSEVFISVREQDTPEFSSLDIRRSFIAFSVWFLSKWSNSFLKSVRAAKSGMLHSLAFSAAIKMLNAPCSGWLSFANAVFYESCLQRPE